MYSYIKGICADIGEGFAVVDNNGIGYEIFVSNTALTYLRIGAECKLYLYQIVREDELSLYGFSSVLEKSMFLKLIAISGVGPKMALAILSAVNVQNLANAIVSGDYKSLSTIKGIGKKTAERIILELKENVDDELLGMTTKTPAQGVADSVVSNALDALENMGLPRSQAYELVMKARQETSNLAEIIRIVLRGLKK